MRTLSQITREVAEATSAGDFDGLQMLVEERRISLSHAPPQEQANAHRLGEVAVTLLRAQRQQASAEAAWLQQVAAELEARKCRIAVNVEA